MSETQHEANEPKDENMSVDTAVEPETQQPVTSDDSAIGDEAVTSNDDARDEATENDAATDEATENNDEDAVPAEKVTDSAVVVR